MKLQDIYSPIDRELAGVEEFLAASLKRPRNGPISRINGFLLESRGKRLRPALVILSAGATACGGGRPAGAATAVITIAAAMELIHMASLIHDDVIDRARTRHNRPTVNTRWGRDVAIAAGDYLYAEASDLVASCGNMEVLRCVSAATKAMCEGELLQVCERDNLGLIKERYLLIVRNKTATLFAASCQAGTLLSNGRTSLQSTLREYGLNFGIAFQIADDYQDLVSDEQMLGKSPGQDIGVGEITLPLLNLLESVPEKERDELKALLLSKPDGSFLRRIRSRLADSGAALRTKEFALAHMGLAKEKIGALPGSLYKERLIDLADFIVKRGFDETGC